MAEAPSGQTCVALSRLSVDVESRLPKLVNARNFSLPKSLVVPYAWMYAPRALSLSEAVNYVSQHEEKDAWGQACTQINLNATRVLT